MSTTTTPKTTSRQKVMAAVAVAASLGIAAVGGFLMGADSSIAAHAAHEAGYRQASTDFCNVKFSNGKESKPITEDIRHYDYVPADTIVADAVCTDDQVRHWNEAQERAGSPIRACKLDYDLVHITLVMSVAECIAPESLN